MTFGKYKKTIYELVKEAAYHLGRAGNIFTYDEVLDYIRKNYPDSPHKDNSIYLHLMALSVNNKWGKNFNPSLYQRAFLILIGSNRFKIANEYIIKPSPISSNPPTSPTPPIPPTPPKPNPEEIAKRVMERHFGIKLEKKNVNIFGKYKEFDLVNIENCIVGDVKHYSFKGINPSSEFTNLSEYCWLMEKLEKWSGKKWKKFIVGLGNKETFEKYVKQYGPWLGDIEIYFIDDNEKLMILRNPSLGL
ncbi:MAG: hypothetical protein QXD41_03360 [Nitrososphaeria archaeon]